MYILRWGAGAYRDLYLNDAPCYQMPEGGGWRSGQQGEEETGRWAYCVMADAIVTVGHGGRRC